MTFFFIIIGFQHTDRKQLIYGTYVCKDTINIHHGKIWNCKLVVIGYFL